MRLVMTAKPNTTGRRLIVRRAAWSARLRLAFFWVVDALPGVLVARGFRRSAGDTRKRCFGGAVL
jgi:hypothetical protein